jgi:ribosome-associated translation inhibitor RaiA
MISVIFKNLDKSEFARNLALERLSLVFERFPDMHEHRIQVTLSMQNSPAQPGPDLFTVKVFINGKRYRFVVIEKSAISLYIALADVADHAHERLSRFGEKRRTRRRLGLRRAGSLWFDENKGA